MKCPGLSVEIIRVRSARWGSALLLTLSLTATALVAIIAAQTPLPTLKINNITVTEGNFGTTDAVFNVTLSHPSDQLVTVDFATENAQAIAGQDYTTTSGTLTFNPGELSKTITVLVTGDVVDELGEFFLLALRNPTNATVSGGEAFGECTILNHDNSLLPAASINDVSVTEGDSGTTNAVFTVTLTTPSLSTVRVFFNMTGGSATAGQDFTPFPGGFVFSPGQTVDTINLQIHGDTFVEQDETFFVDLIAANIENATIADGQGIVTIVNDDVAQPVRTLPNLLQVVIFETTNGTLATRYAPNAPQLATRLPDPMTGGNSQLQLPLQRQLRLPLQLRFQHRHRRGLGPSSLRTSSRGQAPWRTLHLPSIQT